jgi:hypothetical protein
MLQSCAKLQWHPYASDARGAHCVPMFRDGAEDVCDEVHATVGARGHMTLF